MTEPAMDASSQEEDKEEEGENEEMMREKSENSHIGAKTPFLAELNLVLVLSFMSLSSEESSELEEMKKKEKEEEATKLHAAKDTMARLQARRREINEFKVVERQSARVHTRMVDCRYNFFSPLFISSLC
ncbi:hypothetical protein NMG60_11028950 [Bertholletia excelsa]